MGVKAYLENYILIKWLSILKISTDFEHLINLLSL